MSAHVRKTKQGEEKGKHRQYPKGDTSISGRHFDLCGARHSPVTAGDSGTQPEFKVREDTVRKQKNGAGPGHGPGAPARGPRAREPPVPAGRGALPAPRPQLRSGGVVGAAGASGTVDWDVDWDVDWEADGAARSHARRGGLRSRRPEAAFPRGEGAARGCEPLV